MKGLLLAGGHGTRLRPLTFSGNKHMIPIANQPMLFYGLQHLRDAGVREAAVILGPIREGIAEQVGDGSRFGLHVTYVPQAEPKGLAHAVLCAREFLGDDPFLMYLGDNMLEHGAKPFADRFGVGDARGVVGVVPVKEPSQYGVAELDARDTIVSVEEKPKSPRSNLAVVGVYLFDPAIHDVIAQLRPSQRGELEITDAIRQLQQETGQVRVIRLDGWWKDTGRPEDLLEANERVLASRPRNQFHLRGQIDPHASVSGLIELGEGSTVGPGTAIRGPVAIGRDVHLEDGAFLGPYTSVGDHSVIRKAEVDRTILMEGVNIDARIRIVDSIIGRGATLNARTHPPSGESFIIGDACRIIL